MAEDIKTGDDGGTGDDSGGDTKSGGKPKDGRVTMDDVRQVVEDAIAPIKEALLGKGDSGGEEETKEESSEKETDTKGRSFSPRHLEHMAEQAVKDAAAKIKHETDHAKLDEKKESEAPPTKKRFSTRIMGW